MTGQWYIENWATWSPRWSLSALSMDRRRAGVQYHSLHRCLELVVQERKDARDFNTVNVLPLKYRLVEEATGAVIFL